MLRLRQLSLVLCFFSPMFVLAQTPEKLGQSAVNDSPAAGKPASTAASDPEHEWLPPGVDPVVPKGEDPTVATIVIPKVMTAEEEAAEIAASAAAPSAADVPTTAQRTKEEEEPAAAGKEGAKPAKEGAKPAKESAKESKDKEKK